MRDVSGLPEFNTVHLVTAPLVSQIELVDKKHVECELIIVETKLVAVVLEAQCSPNSNYFVAKEMLLDPFIVLMSPYGHVHVLSVRNDAAVSVPSKQSTRQPASSACKTIQGYRIYE